MKNKLNLKSLEIKSFVTSNEEVNGATLKGGQESIFNCGSLGTCGVTCPTLVDCDLTTFSDNTRPAIICNMSRFCPL